MMENVGHKALVLSGKGGVGKSSIAANLAVWLSMRGKQVGLLDVDIHGPSTPKLLNLEGRAIEARGEKIEPVLYGEGLKVMSVGFLLPDDASAVIWRGPMKHNLIKQFSEDVSWGRLDWLVIDCPPGTGDEPLSVVQTIGTADGAIVVTTPQELSVVDVKKCITFCRQLNLRVLGVIENMSGFVCPHCSGTVEVFGGGGGEQMAAEFDVPFLGRIPLDGRLVSACDSGEPFVCSDEQSGTTKALDSAFRVLLETITESEPKGGENEMRIAVPVTNGRLSSHFGHCEEFAVIDADPETKGIKGQQMMASPAHEPGALPRWLSRLCVDVVIAGGMGRRAQMLLEQNKIDVVVGAPDNAPEEIVAQYLKGELRCGENVCEH
jgi:ATP-binding protein involved in chromosome partitioning